MRLQRKAGVIVAVVSMGWSLAEAQCDDHFDNVLCVYTLSSAEEAQFSSTDGRVSPFWASWSGRDYFELTAPDDCYPGRCGFSGPDDAGLICKAAGSPRGLYLYLEARDNVWVDRADVQDIGADATDMFLDIYDANYLFTCNDCRVGLWESLLSYTTNQFQIWFGSNAPPTNFSFQYYDQSLWSWTQTFTAFADAKNTYGFEVEIVTIDATHKAQEWFFPWEKLGTQGIPVGTPLGGKRVAFAGGYNDKDGDNPENHCLRWTGKDPWVSENFTVNYWGDLLLASDMGNVAPWRGESVRPDRNTKATTLRVPQACTHGYYTLRGERINGQALSKSSAVLLREDRGSRHSVARVVVSDR